jgi:hypothetical protein
MAFVWKFGYPDVIHDSRWQEMHGLHVKTNGNVHFSPPTNHMKRRERLISLVV